jgi:hypothetical protein
VRRVLPALVLLALPAAAEACAVCGAAVDRNRTAFLVTTILLSFLPLALMAAGLAWIVKRSRGAIAGGLADRAAASDAAKAPGAGGR